VPSLKAIRKRIVSVQSTQKITRAMKMVAGARLNRAQIRITELRPYAVKTHSVLASITAEPKGAAPAAEESALAVVGDAATEVAESVGWEDKPAHPLLVTRAEKRVLLLVLTSDRGLCGAFNTNLNKRAEREWKTRTAEGQDVQMIVVGRKGRDYMTRRGAPVLEFVSNVWDKLNHETAKMIGAKVLAPFLTKDVEQRVDAIYVIYSEFKSAMTQIVTCERLLPVAPPVVPAGNTKPVEEVEGGVWVGTEFIFEPTREALLTQLMPMYLDISILRALYESQASELGARMTAMDAATKNAKEMISSLTLQYNKARQAAITKELMEIIGGSEAIKE
jgi:F-type H+-transporting ATPase subunit gamma